MRDKGFRPEQVRTALFQYGRTNGEIHELIARTVANDERIDVPPESVVVTVGAQEGMLLALRALFARPDDVLLVGSPCYVGITGAARLLDVGLVPVPEGDDGLDPDTVRGGGAAVRGRPGGGHARCTWCRTSPIRPVSAWPCGTGGGCSTSPRNTTCWSSRTIRTVSSRADDDVPADAEVVGHRAAG